MHAITEESATEVPAPALDLVLLYPGAIEGGADQVIIDLVSKVVLRPEVAAWAFERTLDPVPVIALLLDVEASALSDIIDECEDMLSSSLRDDPTMTVQPLVDMPSQGQRGADVPWGVRHSRIDASSGAIKLRQHMAQEQAISEVVLITLSNVRSKRWDRKTIAPTLLAELLGRVVGEKRVATDAYRVMQQILSDHPANESLTRQFRANAHKLLKAEIPILLKGEALDELLGEISPPILNLSIILKEREATGDIAVSAAVWKRMAGGIGFSAVEAAYIACLVSNTGRSEL